MGEYASKGLALGTSIPALALAGLNTLANGGVGNILGNNQSAEKDAVIAQLRSEKYTDGAVLDLYKSGQSELKERDLIIRDLTIAATQNACNVNNIEKDVVRLQEITAAQNVEIADSKVREAELNGRVNTLAVMSKERTDNLAKEFYTALGCETDARKAADEAIYAWTNCNFARNKKVIPAEDICPSVVTSKDVMNYYLAGNTAQTPAATGGECCVSNGVSGSNIDK